MSDTPVFSSSRSLLPTISADTIPETPSATHLSSNLTLPSYTSVLTHVPSAADLTNKTQAEIAVDIPNIQHAQADTPPQDSPMGQITATTQPFHLLALARELRDEVLSQVFLDNKTRVVTGDILGSQFLRQLASIAYTTPQLYAEYLPIFLSRTNFFFRTPVDVDNFVLAIDSLPVGLNAWSRIRTLTFELLDIVPTMHLSAMWSPAYFSPGVQSVTVVLDDNHLYQPPAFTALRSVSQIADAYQLDRLWGLPRLGKVTLVCRWRGTVVAAGAGVFWDLIDLLTGGFVGSGREVEVREFRSVGGGGWVELLVTRRG
ncbi:hypothetical protein P280DRAFT_154895 [Massarina eburnea CBS 473.64]|uniref:Uncharacterized protein n=1 Tax=Massarina eburnea CBS 473.64 TaxID=1395130 RepID=A0A6A6RM34_9PLEO|nr:hypothetical protein P280DRAFT_154895 [Massarina eburnea CBS 473.64]